MKAPWSDPGLRELLALAALAAFGCGLALARDNLFFAAIFAAASAVVIIEALRRFRQPRDTCPKTVTREVREASRIQSAHSLPSSKLPLGVNFSAISGNQKKTPA
jgi:hypothetical protein